MRSLSDFLLENPWEKPSWPRVRGLGLSARAYQVASTFVQSQKSQLVVVSSPRDFEVWKDDLESLLPGQVFAFPGLGMKVLEELEPNLSNSADRIQFRMALMAKQPSVFLIKAESLLEKWVDWENYRTKSKEIKTQEEIDPEALAQDLLTMGFKEETLVENPGEFSLRGEILDVYGLFMENPMRIEFFGDEVESIRSFDLFSQRSVEVVQTIRIQPLYEWVMDKSQWESGFKAMSQHVPEASFWRDQRLLEQNFSGILWDLPYFHAMTSSIQQEAKDFTWWVEKKEALAGVLAAKYKSYEDLFWQHKAPLIIAELFHKVIDLKLPPETFDLTDVAFPGQESWIESVEQTRSAKGEDYQEALERLDSYIVCHSEGQALRLKSLLADVSYQEILVGNLHGGFTHEASGWALVTDHQLFNRLSRKKPSLRKGGGVSIPDFDSLAKGDFIIHRDYGIGRFAGISRIQTPSGIEDCVLLEYSGKDKLSLPVAHLYKLERFSNQDIDKVKLHKLGGKAWEGSKARAKKSAVVIAQELVALYAKRQVQKGFAYPLDSNLQNEFEKAFEYDPTPDQIRATQECKRDLERDKPMDRLICGDVGFGKTEVAMRAAFKVICAQKQVCLLVPTTVLASQHFESFVDRFATWPVEIELLNRYRSTAEKKAVFAKMAEGQVDIVIGTHTLLSERARFKNLGLVIIDEEQKFGVKQKEKLNELKLDVDTLCMSATPIPRTLHMSLSGVRDISLITTPPRNRLPVETRVTSFNHQVLKEALALELDRGGQVFVVNNHIKGLDDLYRQVEEWLPSARVAMAHGQMNDKDLEQVMSAFVHREFDVLVCTTNIEAGIDIPSVNTIVINNAHHFGVSQLYQLRGRVGRGDVNAFAYLVTPSEAKLSLDSQKRLHALETHTDLGSGYQLAMRDLEIRGAGNLLGTQQSGLILEVGYETYLRFVRQAVAELKGEKPEAIEVETRLDLGEDFFIPESFIEDPIQRIALYQKMARVKDFKTLQQIREELADRFGRLPNIVEHLVDSMGIRYGASRLGIGLVEKRKTHVVLTFSPNLEVTQDKISKIIERSPVQIRFLYNNPLQIVLVLKHKQKALQELFAFFHHLLEAS